MSESVEQAALRRAERSEMPTYRIDLKHDTHSATLPWDAKITRLSDDRHMVTKWGTSQEEALRAAQEWIRQENAPHELGGSVLATDDGELISPHPA